MLDISQLRSDHDKEEAASEMGHDNLQLLILNLGCAFMFFEPETSGKMGYPSRTVVVFWIFVGAFLGMSLILL